MTLAGVELVQVKKVSQGHWAYCEDCAAFLGSPYWSLAKSVWLHAPNAHKVTFWNLPSA